MFRLLNTLKMRYSLKFKRIFKVPINLVASGTYIYPIYGVYYFFNHPSLWLFYLTILTPQLIIIFLIYVVCYVTLFPIQAFFTIILAGPFGLISAWLTVLQQSSSISGLLVAIVLLPEVQKIVFDAVLSREFKDDVVLIGKLRRVVKVPFLIKFGYSVFIVPQMLILPVIIVRVIFFLIIGSIPVVGPLIVILVQASSKGLQSHSRYFALKGFDSRQVKAIYRENTGQYMGFGIVANLLESIPVLNIFFMFTNAIGSGLWVVSIEEKIAKKGS